MRETEWVSKWAGWSACARCVRSAAAAAAAEAAAPAASQPRSRAGSRGSQLHPHTLAMERKDQPKGICEPPTHSICLLCTRYSTASRTLRQGNRTGVWSVSAVRHRQQKRGGRRRRRQPDPAAMVAPCNRPLRRGMCSAWAWHAQRKHSCSWAITLVRAHSSGSSGSQRQCSVEGVQARRRARAARRLRPTLLNARHAQHQQPSSSKEGAAGRRAHRTSGGVRRSSEPSSRDGNCRKLPDGCSEVLESCRRPLSKFSLMNSGPGTAIALVDRVLMRRVARAAPAQPVRPRSGPPLLPLLQGAPGGAGARCWARQTGDRVHCTHCAQDTAAMAPSPLGLPTGAARCCCNRRCS